LLINIPGQTAEKGIVDDLLIERGIFSSAVLPWIVDKKFTLGDAGRTKGIRLDNVRTRFKKSAMDVADHFWLGKREEVTIVEQALLRVLEALPANVRFRHPVRADRRTHRPVNDGNPILKDLFKRMLVGFRHVFSLDFERLRFSLNLATSLRKCASL
jgi:hypothetical protein